MIIEERAYARAGLLGNPSDGYFGKTISISVKNFSSHISLYETPELHIEPQKEDLNLYPNIFTLVESIQSHGYYGGDRLIKAAIKAFVSYCKDNKISIPLKNFTVRYDSSIPRQVGLAGSSAIITAVMRALIKFYEIEIPIEILPTLILKVETDELGIKAGLQDRVIQVYEGCVYMDFDEKMIAEKGHGKYERINTDLLPNVYIAYRNELSKISGNVLNNIYERFHKGEGLVVNTIKQIGDLAEEGYKAILDKDYNTLNELINLNFDLRSKIMNISDSNIELVNTARVCGASAKFAGSGGSIIGLYKDDAMLTNLIVELKKINARVIKPYII